MSSGIVKYLKSPIRGNGQIKPTVVAPVDEKKVETLAVTVCTNASKVEPTAGPSQRSKSEEDRIIAENMASVLKSLKKKRNHKCSRRRRNEEHKGRDRHRVTEETELVEVVEDVEKDAIRRSPRKSKKDTTDAEKDKSAAESSSNEQKDNTTKKVNAFQLMMSSRNKAIGSNSPGKDEAKTAEDPEDQMKRGIKIKRKLKLEEWAESKGAGKRKLQEAAEEEFIAHQLNRRAKRMKRLIKNMETNDSDDQDVVHVEALAKDAPQTKPESPKKHQLSTSLKLKARQGRRRLSSEDSTQSTLQGVASADASKEKSPERTSKGDNFVDKLSSPLKKKDSLLGYFSKVAGKDNSPGSATDEKSPASSRIRRRSTVNSPKTDSPANRGITEQNATPEKPISANLDGVENSGRPRRSCARKVKDYAVLAGTSPEKEAVTRRTSNRKAIVTPLKILNVGSPQTMKVVKSPSVRSLSIDQDAPGTPKSAKNVKLAPVFVKKPVEDPEKVRARQEFLMSGIPEKMRLELDKQRCFEEFIFNESPVFPLISHIQQLSSPKKNMHASLQSSRIKVLTESPVKALLGSLQDDDFEYSSLTNCDDSVVEDILAKLIDRGNLDQIYSFELPDLPNVKSIVREWKQTYRHFPVFKCYKQFRNMYEEHVDVGSPPGRQSKKYMNEDSIELVEPHFSSQNGELLFTEKYKPTCSDHILVNCQPAVALKKFLSAWKETRSLNQYDSEDDFDVSNSSVSSNSTSMCNHVVLVGPTGCGKTCNVYAVANDMNFNVLELNASSRRKGKIILQELQEATQSHQVRRKDEQVDIFKKVLARKNSKTTLRKLSTDSDSGVSAKKLSLILIEDADIVFDQDDGFVAAINQLISTSKRPIVLTTTNPNCSHLSRYIGNNVIRYVAPGIGHVAKLLSLLALVEKVHIDQHDLARLYALNRKDIRKTVNELQFFIQTGGDRDQLDQLPAETPLELREENDTQTTSIAADDEASHQSNASSTHSELATVSGRKHKSLFRLFNRDQNNPDQLISMPLDFDNLWCNMERVLQTVPACISKGVKKRKKKGKQSRQPIGSELEELVFFYQNVSSAALVQRDAKRDEDRLVNSLEEEMAHDLVEDCWERWFEGDLEQEPVVPDRRRSGVGAMCYDSLKQFDTDDRQLISACIGINPIRTRSTYCDYEPYLRTICRYERERSKLERRSSRFYHYFRNFMFTSANPTPTVGGSMVTNFSVEYFDALSTRFEEDHIPTSNDGKAKAAVESSDESR